MRQTTNKAFIIRFVVTKRSNGQNLLNKKSYPNIGAIFYKHIFNRILPAEMAFLISLKVKGTQTFLSYLILPKILTS